MVCTECFLSDRLVPSRLFSCDRTFENDKVVVSTKPCSIDARKWNILVVVGLRSLGRLGDLENIKIMQEPSIL